MTRIEDLRHTHVSHKWLSHSDACADSVLTPRDYITNAQNRLGNRSYTCFGECRLCGSFLDAQLDETVQHRRSHWRAPCLRSRFLERTETHGSRIHHGTQRAHRTTIGPADLFTTAAVQGRSAALDVCGVLQCSSSPEEMQRKLLQIAKLYTTEEKSHIDGNPCGVHIDKDDFDTYAEESGSRKVIMKTPCFSCTQDPHG